MNRDHYILLNSRSFNQGIIRAFELFVTTYHRLSNYYPLGLFLWAGGTAMKGISGIILRGVTVVFGTAVYALIGMAIAAAG